MIDSEDRREFDGRGDPVTKSTALPAVSVGFALLLAGSFVWLGQWKAEKEAEHTSVQGDVARNTRRFDAYSGRTGSNTADIKALRRELVALKLWITEEHGEVPRWP